VSKCSEPARLKKRILFEQASMLSNSRNIGDRRKAQPGFYQLVPETGRKGTRYKFSEPRAQPVALVLPSSVVSYVIWWRFVVRKTLSTSGYLVHDALCFKPLPPPPGGGGHFPPGPEPALGSPDISCISEALILNISLIRLLPKNESVTKLSALKIPFCLTKL
jgi:hypothetical protein